MSALAVALVAASTLAAGGGEARVVDVAGLSVTVPADAEVTEQPDLPEHTAVVAVTTGEEVLLLTVYAGEARPDPKRALNVHAEELERRLATDGPIETKAFRLKVLRRHRRGRVVTWTEDGVAMVGRVLAVAVGKRTVVASWTVPKAQPGSDAQRVVESLAAVP